jgi:hypothetical protein
MLQINNAKTAKKSARSLEKFLAKAGIELSHGKALDALAVMAGFRDWNSLAHARSQEALDAQMQDMERGHIAANTGLDYGAECAMVTHTGFELRYSAEGDVPDYVRVCDPLGREIAYWTSDEWAEDPQLVMGAILGALMRGRPELRGSAEHLSAGAAEALESNTGSEVCIQDVPLQYAANVLLNGNPYRIEFRDDDMLAMLHQPAGDADEEDDCHHIALQLSRDEDGLVWEETVTLHALRQLGWDAEKECFVSPEGDTYEFFIESKFKPSGVSRREAVAAPSKVASAKNTAPAKPKRVLFTAEVYADGEDGDDLTHLGTWVGAATSKADARNQAIDAHWDARLDCAGASARAEVARADESDHGPFTVFIDRGFYAEVPYFGQAVETAEFMLDEVAEKEVSIQCANGAKVLRLTK